MEFQSVVQEDKIIILIGKNSSPVKSMNTTFL